MSKAVKKVGRFVKKVVKGVGNALKKFSKSGFGKIILAAATVYFGGAALMGAMGGASAAGTGFMSTLSGAISGAGAGISSAWTGLTGAASAAMGGNFAAAGSSLSGGFTGAYGAGSGAVLGTGTGLTASAGGATGLTAPASSAATSGGSQYALTAGTGNAGLTAGSSTIAPAIGATPAASPGIISGAWNGLGDYGKMAAVQAGGKIIEGAGQQKALKEQQEREDQLAENARNRYNENVGVMSFGRNFGQDSGAAPSVYAKDAPTGLVTGAMTPLEQYEEEMRRQQQSYNPYQLRTF